MKELWLKANTQSFVYLHLTKLNCCMWKGKEFGQCLWSQTLNSESEVWTLKTLNHKPFWNLKNLSISLSWFLTNNVKMSQLAPFSLYIYFGIGNKQWTEFILITVCVLRPESKYWGQLLGLSTSNRRHQSWRNGNNRFWEK